MNEAKYRFLLHNLNKSFCVVECMRIEFTPHPGRRREPNYHSSPNIDFASIQTDHMLLMRGNGTWKMPSQWEGHFDWEGNWRTPKIVPFGPLEHHPDMLADNYGAAQFEGGKALMIDGELYTWRLELNGERSVVGGQRLLLAVPPVEEQLEGIHALLDVDRLFYPVDEQGKGIEGASCYIRPLYAVSTRHLGVQAGGDAECITYLRMGGPYFKGNLRLWLQDEYHRAEDAGDAKARGNYAYHLLPKAIAVNILKAQEVLYLDQGDRYIRETGASNVFIDRNGKIIFPPFADGVLESNTTKTFYDLKEPLGKKGITLRRQREITLDELLEGIASGDVTGMGAVGNAAVVSPVTELVIATRDYRKDRQRTRRLPLYKRYEAILRLMKNDGKARDGEDGSIVVTFGNGQPSEASREMYNLLWGMQTGVIPAPEGWLKKVERMF